jgi:tetratricopeptide (TPR) repeat protein
MALGCSSSPKAPSPVAPAPASAPAVAERFDFKVRQDFFDGLRGDKAALDRSMKVCEDALAKNANDPEPLVWHGAGTIARASVAFRAGDPQTGIPLFTKGLAEMDRAVELAPDHVGVRIPRGAVLLATAPFTPEPQKSSLLKRGIEDYEKTLAIQGPRFATQTLHSREQLLYGLLDGYAALGDLDKAQSYLERMQRDAAGSELLARAQARATGGKVEGTTPCEQCHAGRR